MPKTTKKKSILSQINLKSTKSRILVTVLLFALVGGGVMVYRSFAALPVGVTTGTIGCDLPGGVTQGFINNGYCTKTTDFGKNAPVVYDVARASVYISQYGINIEKGSTFRVCGLMRSATNISTGQGTSESTVMLGTATSIPEQKIVLPANGGNANYCGAWATYTADRYATVNARVTNGVARVTSLSVEISATPTPSQAPSQAPAPGKNP